MRNLRALLGAWLVAAAVTASRAEEPDDAAAALVRRMWAACPAPGDGGPREVRCSVRADIRGVVPVHIGLTWTADDVPDLTFASLALDERSIARIETTVRARVFAAATFRHFWSPRRIADPGVTAAPAPDGTRLVLGSPDRPLATIALTPQERPREMRLFVGPRGNEVTWTRVACKDRDAGWAVASFTCTWDRETFGVALAHHDAVREFAMPRRIDVTKRSETETYVLFDVVVDGRRVEGTSYAEARIGRLAKVDAAARAAFDRHRAATRFEPPGEASWRAEVRTGAAEPLRFRMRWWSDGVCHVRAEAGTPETEAARAVAAALIRTGLSPDVTMLDGCDATTSPDGSVVVDPLDPAGPTPRRTLRFDDAGRIASVETDAARADLAYASAGGRAWIAATTHTDATASRTARREVWDVAGFPVLTRRETEGETTVTCTDWVVDGRPVPGTETGGK